MPIVFSFYSTNSLSTLQGSFSTLLTHNQAHEEGIWSVCWARGGSDEAKERIVTGSLDDTVKAWTFREDPEPHLDLRYIFDGHSLGVISVDISADGKKAATSSIDCHIRFWDLDSGNPVEGTKHTSKIDAGPIDSWTIAYSPDMSLIATGNHTGKIIVYSTEDGKRVKEKLEADKQPKTTGKQPFFLSVAFSPDGTKVASGATDGFIKIFDVGSDEVKLIQSIEGHAMPVRTLAFSPDSRYLITGSDDQHINLYDLNAQRPLSTLSGHGSWVLCVDFSPDGRRFASR